MRLASSSYYYEPLTDPEERDRNDAELRDHIERLQGEFPGYGYRRLGQQLRREGIVVNDKKIRRVQRKYQLFPIRWHSFKISTTDSNHGHKVYPNLLTGKTLTGINQAWVADITYIRILKGFVFLAAILDRYSRKLIGWAISKRIDAELCWAALKSALETRQPPPGCIHHSDRGVQYACREYIDLLEQANMQISMSRTANPYDNAHMESFFKTLKYEEEAPRVCPVKPTAGERKAHRLGQRLTTTLRPANGKTAVWQESLPHFSEVISNYLNYGFPK